MTKTNIQVQLNGRYTKNKDIYTYKDNLIICKRKGSTITVNKESVTIQTDVTGIDKIYAEIKEDKITISNNFKDFSLNKTNKELLQFQRIKGYVPYPFTILQNVIKAPPGIKTNISLNEDGAIEYSFIPSEELKIFNKEGKFNKKEFGKKFTSLLVNNAKDQKEIVSSFSGGFDSLLLTKIYEDKCKQIVHFSEDKKIDMSIYQKQFEKCKWTITDNLEPFSESDRKNYFKSVDEPNCDSAGFAEYLMIKKLNESKKRRKYAVMNGQACDGLFTNGKSYFQEFIASSIPERIRKTSSKKIHSNSLMLKMHKYSCSTKTRFMEMYIGNHSFSKKIKDEIEKIYDIYEKTIKNDSTNKFAAATVSLKYSLHGIEKIRTAAHAFNTKYYLPFMSENIIKYAFSIPSKHKVGFRTGKKILIKSYPEIGKLKFITRGFEPNILKERFIGKRHNENNYTDYYIKKWIEQNKVNDK